MSEPLHLERLPQLAELFRLFSNGRHLNRVAEPALWAELEQQQGAYQALFAALGFELRIDGRGFAWFHTEELSANLTNQSRQLALLFMVLFDTQADAGQALGRFPEWRLDRRLLEAAVEQHEELLTAEGLDVDGLFGLLETAGRFGFAREVGGLWELLPAVSRYLDHFEALAAVQTGEDEGADPLADLAVADRAGVDPLDGAAPGTPEPTADTPAKRVPDAGTPAAPPSEAQP